MTVQEVVSMPHLINRFGTYDLEKNTKAEMMKGPLSIAGFDVKSRGLNSGLQVQLQFTKTDLKAEQIHAARVWLTETLPANITS